MKTEVVPFNTSLLEKLQYLIVSEMYHQFPETTVTICCLRLSTGFAAVGKSACVNHSSFNAELGKRVALDRALQEADHWLGLF